jgi:hypothetical protein
MSVERKRADWIAEAAAAKTAEIEHLEDAVAALDPDQVTAYLQFAWTPNGYALLETSGGTASVGARLAVNGSRVFGDEGRRARRSRRRALLRLPRAGVEDCVRAAPEGRPGRKRAQW